MQQQTRRLVLMRHGQAEQDGQTDFERVLTERGRTDTASTGAWLAEQGVTPDHALVSAATRAHQTWDSVASGGGWSSSPARPRAVRRGAETALDILHTAPAEATTLVVVGHNPTIATVAQMLDDGDGDVEASTQMAMRATRPERPRSSRTTATWAELAEGTCSVVAFHAPA